MTSSVSPQKSPLVGLLPIVIFLMLFLGSGIYFYLTDVPYAFYQVSPTVAILPALIIGVMAGRGSLNQKIQSLITGMGHGDIISMCLIFILAGAFGVVTKAIGCVDDLVHVTLAWLPAQALLPGLFMLACFMSLSIGTSMGVVAAITPIAVGFIQEAGMPGPLTIGTVIGGTMFGDNLSIISDTTIASVNSQRADFLTKFKFNALLASVAGLIVLVILFQCDTHAHIPPTSSYSLLKVAPYVAILILAVTGMNVFSVLILGLLGAGIVGLIDHHDYTLVALGKDIYKGFESMNEIMVLSLLVGGMSGLMKQQGSIDYLIDKVSHLLSRGQKSPKKAEFAIATVVSLNDICIANNTIAILLAGEFAHKIAQKNDVAPHRSATWLGVFSCVFQGILPYSAQILLACSIANLSPLTIVPYVYYCYVLLAVSVLYLMVYQPKKGGAHHG